MFQDPIKQPKKSEEEVYAEKLENTKVIKGFRAMVYSSDILSRYPFSLRETKGGLIFSDRTTNTKLRRKKIQGQPDQNYVFQAYQTVDNQPRIQAEVEISSTAFPPSLIIAATAAKLARLEDVEPFGAASVFLRMAAALIQDGELLLAKRKEINPNGVKEKNDVYDIIVEANANANAIAAIKNINDAIVGGFSKDKTNISNYADISSRYLEIKRAVEKAELEGTTCPYSRDDIQEMAGAINLLHSAITDFSFSSGFANVQEMGVQVREELAHAANIEVSGEEK